MTSVHPWDDIRIFKKEAVSTAKFAKQTYLVAANAPNTIADGVEIVNVTFPTNHSRLKRILFLKNRVIDKALALDADIYHLHDPELLSGVKKLRRKGKLVVYDSHEDVPKTILSKTWIKPGFVRKMISKFYNRFEKGTCEKCAGVISVLPEITNQFTNKNLETIYNYPFASKPNEEQTSDGFKLIYVGGLTRIRGIKEICEALETLPQEYRLTLVGKWESDAFRTECLSSLSDSSRIEETGFVDHEACQTYIQKADLGLSTLYKEPNYMNSLPIKAYEYATHELPVVMSDIPYWENEFGSFAVFADPTSPSAIATAIQAVRDNYSSYKTKVKAFKNEVLANKNWDAEEKKLIAFYEKILS